MPGHCHLPPRGPLQSGNPSSPSIDSGSFYRNFKSQGRHQRFLSQSLILEEQPAGIDPLFNVNETRRTGVPLRRSVSDSVTLLNNFSYPTCYNNEGNHLYDETYQTDYGGILDGKLAIRVANPMEQEEQAKFCNGMESNFIYGPNSPRRNDVNHLENPIALTLQEYVPPNLICLSGIKTKTDKSESCESHGNIGTETEIPKRYPGQRSRVRRLQHIAELERIVNMFQLLDTELSTKVASLFQQHVILSIENSSLKQQIATLQKEKRIKDVEYCSLKDESDRLKKIWLHQTRNDSSSCFSLDRFAPIIGNIEPDWSLLDMGKLSLSDK